MIFQEYDFSNNLKIFMLYKFVFKIFKIFKTLTIGFEYFYLSAGNIDQINISYMLFKLLTEIDNVCCQFINLFNIKY